MNEYFFLAALGFIAITSTHASPGFQFAKLGERYELEISDYRDIGALTRELSGGVKQTWNLTGSNKGTWVDSKGKKVDSKNYTFKAPGTIIIKKVSAADAGVYDYVPGTPPAPPPPGVHVDPGITGVNFNVIEERP